jgi:hypothetical protein
MKPDIWDRLTEALMAQKEKRPTGPFWLTKHELSKKLGKKVDMVESFIRRNRASFECFSGFVVANNRLISRVWYRPITKTTKPKPAYSQKSQHPIKRHRAKASQQNVVEAN